MVNKSAPRESKGFFAVLILMAAITCLVLPVTVIMYIDILSVRSIVREELIKTIKHRKEIERMLSKQKGDSDD